MQPPREAVGATVNCPGEDALMQELAAINERGPCSAPLDTGLKEAEMYYDQPLASLFAHRIGGSADATSSPYHSYPRLSGSAAAYCVFRDGPLRLDVFGRTYLLHDEAEQREVFLRFPEWFADPVRTDSIGDGSFPCEVWKLRDDAPYLVFWLYPHEAKVHAWCVHADGRRRVGFDLSRASAIRFLSYRAGRSVMFSYRLLLLATSNPNASAAGRVDAPDAELLARIREQLPASDLLAASNADEWGEQACFFQALQRLRLLTACGADIERSVRYIDDADQIVPRLPDVLLRKKREAMASAHASHTAPSEKDARLRDIVESLGRGQNLFHLLIPETLPRVPSSRLPRLRRLADDVSIRVMSPEEHEKAIKLSTDVVLLRVKMFPRVSIDIALPRPFSSPLDLHEFMMRRGGQHNMMPVSHIYIILLSVIDMILSGDIRLRLFLRRELGHVPSALEFYLSWHDGVKLNGIVASGRKKGTANPLIPDLYFYCSEGYAQWKVLHSTDTPPWDKRKRCAIWRGATTGRTFTADTLRDNPRINLAYVCRDFPEIFDAKITHMAHVEGDTAARAKEILQREGLLGNRMAPVDFRNFMFSIDIDGNANAWGFFEKLALGLCVLKVESPWEQWFYPDLKPWTHYVPVDPSLEDLVPSMRELLDNPKMAQAIAENAAAFAAERDIESEAITFCKALAGGVATGAVFVSP